MQANTTQSSAIVSSGKKVISAGVAGLDITPSRLISLQGYGNRNGLATGTLDHLEARAIVFGDGTTYTAIVSADLLGFDSTSVQRIRQAVEERCGVPGRNIMITCSHTHSAPSVQRLAGSPPDDEYLEWVESRVVDSVVEAASAMSPITLGVGQGFADFNVNRRRQTSSGVVLEPNPAGDVDHRVHVLRIDHAQTLHGSGMLGSQMLLRCNPMALLFAYPCHATSLMDDNTRYSADFPGAARRFVESIYGEKTLAMYLPGCSGDIRPHLVGPDAGFRSASDHELTILGRLLGTAVVQGAESTVPGSIDQLGITSKKVTLPFSHVPHKAELLAAAGDDMHGMWANKLLEELERGYLPRSVEGEVQVMRLGNHIIVATSGETMLGIGRAIEHGLDSLGLIESSRGDRALVLGYANGNVGYLCTATSFGEGGYEPIESFDYYLKPGPFKPEIEKTLVKTALDLALELDQTLQQE